MEGGTSDGTTYEAKVMLNLREKRSIRLLRCILHSGIEALTSKERMCVRFY
jgi:hypothetical protein